MAAVLPEKKNVFEAAPVTERGSQAFRGKSFLNDCHRLNDCLVCEKLFLLRPNRALVCLPEQIGGVKGYIEPEENLL
ncbi:hypothetical protein [Paenibacillus sp. URB8-2]|uniref:hypothetical protein n=1 Tax=Paenibacillus sp. URB8-2 TaxID=2741301 RepID=UPI0015BEF925|nr:hypothetical protein [Paenibacillus sp. URB8-2]BCG60910.1 hypothetical protein PUR_43350 [Paenibacillus sp. URB8-2]